MARMHKTVDIETDDGDKKAVTVHELTVRMIIELIGDDGLGQVGDGETPLNTDLASLQAVVDRHLPKATDLKLEDMRDMAPSDLKRVYEAFREVNAVFFDVARAAGLETLLAELKAAMQEDFSRLLVVSSNLGTVTH